LVLAHLQPGQVLEIQHHAAAAVPARTAAWLAISTAASASTFVSRDDIQKVEHTFVEDLKKRATARVLHRAIASAGVAHDLLEEEFQASWDESTLVPHASGCCTPVRRKNGVGTEHGV
jgi:hypothetical protein